ncbi:hypothetical protein TNCT_8281 [Trichonephila clavata]|uniref:Uncharacterized protein n=1 Tax=Trichonephila clavata TaxID=2740835 RepID=A0A8X6GQM7_TRICU|nr:hypothetical protein TNCT_8281 [Trichonephila clavata]
MSQLTGLSFGETGHDGMDCSRKECCINCKGEHPSCSRPCPKLIQEKEITAMKNEGQNFVPRCSMQFFTHASLRDQMLVLPRSFQKGSAQTGVDRSLDVVTSKQARIARSTSNSPHQNNKNQSYRYGSKQFSKMTE